MAQGHDRFSPGHSLPPDSASAAERVAADATQDFREPDELASRLVGVLDQYLADLKAGAAPDRAKLLAAHPEMAEQLEACLAGIEFIHAGAQEGAPPKHLGDFRILGEVGRGGMGAVYEAEQVSLRRRVALKVLRFGAVSDPEAIQRFQREAETVARLHHTNIVPIFAVGCEGGVNYYAMQFIEGRSLDQVLRAQGQPPAAETVAAWGLQAADALAHAHARGVIHRDVKPSNLILDDAEGRIWLTDFGLAKRLDDVTLSMTGALLGTPRYMSPEQAAAANHKLDHRTDIYSLGASLYELATGQPVFTGDSPHNVISQILTVEPAPPRKHRPSLPRDLETILMKCLSKEPGQRYESARQLSDDLRAFLEGRPIAARRASWAERATRWVQRQRRSVALTAGAVAATLLLVALAAAGSYAWHRSRQAQVMLRTDHPPLVAELLRDGQPVVPPVTVPTQHPLEAPAGDYQMRLSSGGRLSQTLDLTLAPRQVFDHEFDLEDQVLWSDVRLDRTYDLAHFVETLNILKSNPPASPSAPGAGRRGLDFPLRRRADILRLTDDGVQCLAGATGSPRWELPLREPAHALLKDGVQIVWPWNQIGSGYERGLGLFDGRPWTVSASPAEPGSEASLLEAWDFNDDGMSDLVLAARQQAWLIAVSGRDGEPLWTTARAEAAQPSKMHWRQPEQGEGVPYRPLALADQNGDGATDFLVTFVHATSRESSQRWIELISGADGESLWRYDLPTELFAFSANESAPYDLRWFFGLSGGYSSGGTSSGWGGNYRTRGDSNLERSGPYVYLPTEPRLIGAETPGVVFLAGKHCVRLHPKTGELLSPPADVGVRTGLLPRYGDFDGDGRTDLLLVEQRPDKLAPQTAGAPRRIPVARLTAWSIIKESPLWRRDVEAAWPRQQVMTLLPPDWPVVADVDGDGAADVLAPDGSTEGIESWNAPPWGKLALLDGATGEPRWRRQLFNLDEQLDCFIAGPDIDDDGRRELYVATLWGEGATLFLDCLSGADGATLWRAEQRLVHNERMQAEYRLGNLAWHAARGDGWPQLVVTARCVEGDADDRLALFSAGTGRLTHLATQAAELQAGDLDADGVDDLVLFRRTDDYAWDQGGVLHAIRGVGGEAWRKANEQLLAVGDLDGDGVQDLAAPQARRRLTAWSGVSGAALWQTEIDSDGHEFFLYPATTRDPRHELLTRPHDLDGDGVPDLLLAAGTVFLPQKRPIVMALSGRTGAEIWRSDFLVQRTEGAALLECRDLDGDRHVEIVFAAATDYGQPHRSYRVGTNDAQLWLAVLSGRDGRLRWTRPLTEIQAQNNGEMRYELNRLRLEAAYIDLDHDRIEEIVLPAQRTPAAAPLDLYAYDGGDGQPLWQFPLPTFHDIRDSFSDALPAAAGDLDGDGRPEVLALTLTHAAGDRRLGDAKLQLHALDGETGGVRWRWETPVERWNNQIDQDPALLLYRLRPVLVRRPDGKQWVAIASWRDGRDLHVLDETGRLVSKTTIPQSANERGIRVWTLDANGDGGDELVFLTETSLLLLSPEDLAKPFWERHESQAEFHRVLGLLPDPSASGRIVVLGGGRDYSLRGVDPATGRFAWTCVGPTSPQLRPVPETAVLLSGPHGAAPPHALYQFQGQALVRRGMSLLAPSAAWRTFARPAATLRPAEHDPRLLRPLPWKPHEHERREIPAFLAWGAFYGVALAAIPVLFVGWTIRRRRWGMKTMLLAPVVAGMTLAAMFVSPEDRDFHSPWNKLLVAFLGAGPVLFAVATLARWLYQGRRRRAAVWLILAALVGVAAMIFNLYEREPGRIAQLQPGERYTWDGWYYIFLPVFYLMSWVLLLTVGGAWLLRAGGTWWNGAKPQKRVHGAAP